MEDVGGWLKTDIINMADEIKRDITLEQIDLVFDVMKTRDSDGQRLEWESIENIICNVTD